ncbi:hypothetical protein ZWY2020_052599 [Hordeum vulgare]|nr:hypothetical protein ZWY2020_052599 [Hordeum vulgare]
MVVHNDKEVALRRFYSSLLGRVTPVSWGLDLEALYIGVPSVDGTLLVAPFTREEIKATVFALDRSSTPYPDGLGPPSTRPPGQQSWGTSKGPGGLFDDVHCGQARLDGLNKALMALLPKTMGSPARATSFPCR